MTKQGFFNINKPSGVSSAFVVSKIKKHFHLSQVGHMGTLDPMASGVLPIAIGKATRMFDYFLIKTKSYIAEFEFGYETDTLDATGVITNTNNSSFTIQQMMSAVNSMIGKQWQKPPLYSAKKIGGKKAYELAREGEIVDLKPKEIEVVKFELLTQISPTKYLFLIECSSGTYIRSICRDLAYKLNSLATMTKLSRTVNGIFDLDNSIELEDVLKADNIENILFNIQQIFPKIPTKVVSDVNYIKLKNGLSLKMENCIDSYYFITNSKNCLLGVGECNKNTLKLKTYLLENEVIKDERL